MTPTKPDEPAVPQQTDQDAGVGLYADAMIYDILHTPGTAEELDALERIAARSVQTSDPALRWLEPACGSGRCVRLAARRGTHATGFDLDPGMIAYANARIEKLGHHAPATALVGDMRTCVSDGTIPPGAFHFAFNTINSFRHLMNDRDALAHLEQMSLALKPGGVYTVGLSTTAFGMEFPSEDVWEGTRGSVRVTQTVQYVPPGNGLTDAERIEQVHSHLTVERPSETEHRDSSYTLRAYSLEQWIELIDASPFEIAETTDHDGNPCEPGMSGYRLFVLRRSGI